MLAQQKISNLSEDLKIALRRGGHGGGRVGRVKGVGRGLFFFFYDGKSKCQEKKKKKKTENVVEQQDGSGRIKGTKS